MGRKHFTLALSAAVAVLLLFAAASFAQQRLSTSQAAKLQDADTLLHRLETRGSLRVIAKLDVPGYGALRASSQAFQGVRPDLSYPRTEALAADASLTSAVAATAGSVAANTAALGGVQHLQTMRYLPYAVFRITPSGLEHLASQGQVLAIAEDKPRSHPEDTADSEEAFIASLQGAAAPEEEPAAPALAESTALIGADAMWSQGATGAGWYVAVLDDGLRTSHEFFSGKNILEACFTSRVENENPSTTLCPNGEDEMIGSGAARPYYYLEEYGATYDHGTHVAGIATGHTADGSRNGVAPFAQLIAVKVFSDGFTAESCRGAETCALAFDSDVITGLEYVYYLRNTYAIAAANMSIGGGDFSSFCDDSPYKAAMDLLLGAGIASPVAAGNGSRCSSIDSPGCVSTAVTVGASDKSDVIASFSDWNREMVELLAPGVKITSSTGSSNSSYEAWNGTSMATPMVAGAFALLRDYAPSATAGEILAALEATAKNVTFNRCDNPTDINRRIQIDQAAAQLDLAAEGQADIWWRNAGTGQNLLWFMDGVNVLTEAPLETVSFWNLGCIGDFNSDGESDAFWHDPVSGQSVIQYMVDRTVAGEVASVTVPAPWAAAACKDFNADGITDIFWNNPTTGRNGVTYLDTSGQLKGGYGFLAEKSSTWLPRGSGDFNADGHPDMVFRNVLSGHTVIMLLNGLSNMGVVSVTTLPIDWNVAGVGDFNGDNRPDLLWRNGSTGQNGVMYMNGTAPNGSTLLPESSPALGWDIGGVGVFH